MFSTDTSRWVKAALHQSLGEVLKVPARTLCTALSHVTCQVIYNCGPKVSSSVISCFLSLASSAGFSGKSSSHEIQFAQEYDSLLVTRLFLVFRGFHRRRCDAVRVQVTACCQSCAFDALCRALAFVISCHRSMPAVVTTLGPAGWNTICPACVHLLRCCFRASNDSAVAGTCFSPKMSAGKFDEQSLLRYATLPKH